VPTCSRRGSSFSVSLSEAYPVAALDVTNKLRALDRLTTVEV
jgi:hypothetical protein